MSETPQGPQGRPMNAKTYHLFAKVRKGYIQEGLGAVPELFETEQQALDDAMAPMETVIYPMSVIPTEDLRRSSESRERVEKALEEIMERADANIPHYAYGDNQAACEMASRLGAIYEKAKALHAASKEGTQ